jgi:hypothetical protein
MLETCFSVFDISIIGGYRFCGNVGKLFFSFSKGLWDLWETCFLVFHNFHNPVISMKYINKLDMIMTLKGGYSHVTNSQKV